VANRLYSLIGTGNPSAPAPYIPSDHAHFPYACHIVAGYSHDEACELLGIKSWTARHWRKELQRVARTYWGRPIRYELAARYAVDNTFRAEYDRFCHEKQNTSLHVVR
jgi:hypothetical protein